MPGVEKLPDGKGLIIAVRSNSGGSETPAKEFAGCLVDKAVLCAKHVYRDRDQPGGFGLPTDRILPPSPSHPKYRGKVAVLTCRVVMSSCVAFLLMMKKVPNCALVGESPYGSSGNPRTYEFPNGGTVKLPSWKTKWPDGRVGEGEGIPPNISVQIGLENFKSRTPVVEASWSIIGLVLCHT